MKIFISAVSSQFKECRISVASDLRAKGHDVKIQEDFTQDGFSLLLERLEVYINQCDCIIAIIGDVYGFEPIVNTNPKRSYTQWEYFFAIGERLNFQKRNRKNVYVYLANDVFLKEHHIDQEINKLNLQIDFIAEVKRSNEHYAEFINVHDLQRLVLRDIEVPLFEDIIKQEYPFFIIDPYLEFKNNSQTTNYKDCLLVFLSFLSNLWLKDIECSSAEVLSNMNNECDSLDEMLKLLNLYSNINNNKNNGLIMNHFKKWYLLNIECLKNLVRRVNIEKKKLLPGGVSSFKTSNSTENFDKNEAIREFTQLYQSLKFITEEFLFIHIETFNDEQLIVNILKGQTCIKKLLIPSKDDFDSIHLNDYFMLSLKYKKAIVIYFESENRKPKLFDLISEDSWNCLIKEAIPFLRKQQLAFFGIQQNDDILFKGKHSELYSGSKYYHNNKDHRNETSSYFISFLKDELVKDKDINNWYIQRALLWQKLIHQNILNIRDKNIAPESQVLFITLDYFRSHRTLRQEKNEKNIELIQNNLFCWIRIISDIIKTAHIQGIVLLSLSTRHILIGKEGEILLTGFDSIRSMDEKLPEEQILRKIFKDYDSFAPEIKAGEISPRPTADIWALGILINKLLVSCEHSFKKRIDEKVQFLLRHCIAIDPEIRFQSIDQFLYFFNKFFSTVEAESIIPETIELENNLRIGKFPIMNYEFDCYCNDSLYHLEPVISPALYLPYRFIGPLLPVVGINKTEAEKYCKWLSIKTKKTWRLPKEDEWIKASQQCITETKLASENYHDNMNYNYRLNGTSVVGSFSQFNSIPHCFDMYGNVWEWCEDRVTDRPLRILKGGSFQSPKGELNASSRKEVVLSYRSVFSGFRVICDNSMNPTI